MPQNDMMSGYGLRPNYGEEFDKYRLEELKRNLLEASQRYQDAINKGGRAKEKEDIEYYEQQSKKAEKDIEYYKQQYEYLQTPRTRQSKSLKDKMSGGTDPRTRSEGYTDYMMGAYASLRPVSTFAEHGHTVTGEAHYSDEMGATHPYLRPDFLKWLKEKQKTPAHGDMMEFELRKKLGGEKEGLSSVEKKYNFLMQPSQRELTKIQDQGYRKLYEEWLRSQGYM